MRRRTGPGHVERIRPAPGVPLRALLWNFDFDWHELKQEHKEWVWTDAADALSFPPQSWVLIRAFASRQGDFDYNKRLAQRRGEAVAEEIDRSTGRRIPHTILKLGESLQTHHFAERGGEDEDVHRSVEVSIHLGPGQPTGVEEPEFEGEVVIGSVRQDQNFPAFRRVARRFAPTIPPMPERSRTDDAQFLWDVVSGLRDVAVNGGNPAGEALGLVNDARTALENGDERIVQMAAVYGYADTMGRMVAALPPTPQGRQPQLPHPVVTDELRQRFMSNELWLQGYSDGHGRVRRLLTELNNVRRPGEWPAERILIHLRYRYAGEAEPAEVRSRVRDGILSEVLGIELGREIRASVSPRQTP
jgi:hypothetical protein